MDCVVGSATLDCSLSLFRLLPARNRCTFFNSYPNQGGDRAIINPWVSETDTTSLSHNWRPEKLCFGDRYSLVHPKKDLLAFRCLHVPILVHPEWLAQYEHPWSCSDHGVKFEMRLLIHSAYHQRSKRQLVGLDGLQLMSGLRSRKIHPSAEFFSKTHVLAFVERIWWRRCWWLLLPTCQDGIHFGLRPIISSMGVPPISPLNLTGTILYSAL